MTPLQRFKKWLLQEYPKYNSADIEAKADEFIKEEQQETAELRAELERMKGFVDSVDDKLYLFLLNGIRDCTAAHGKIVKSIKMGNSVVLTFKDGAKYKIIFTRGGVEEVCLDDKNA